MLWCDNVSTLALASNPVFHSKTKHIEVDFHYVREKVIPKDLYDRFVSSKGNSIDYLNKPLTAPRLIYLEANSWWIPPPFI